MKLDVNLIYVEVLNETEQYMIFAVDYEGKTYGLDIALNTALPAEVQDVQIRRLITKLTTMKLVVK